MVGGSWLCSGGRPGMEPWPVGVISLCSPYRSDHHVVSHLGLGCSFRRNIRHFIANAAAVSSHFYEGDRGVLLVRACLDQRHDAFEELSMAMQSDLCGMKDGFAYLA